MNNKTVNKIISVMIALFLWVFVITEVNPVTQSTMPTVPVSLLNEESLASKGLAVAGDGGYAVDVVMEGQRADVAKVSQEDIVVTADVFGYGKGQSYLEVTVKGPSSLTSLESKPARIPVTIEDLVTVGKNVSLEVSGLDSSKAEVGNIILSPEQIDVSGAKSQVAKVNRILVKADGNKIKENGSSMQLKAVPVDASGTVVSNVELSSDTVKLSAKLYTVKDVNLKLVTEGAVANGYTISSIDVPKTVKVKGPASVLEGLDSVSMEPVNLNGLSANATLKVNIALPDRVELADENKIVRAGIILKSVGSKEFTFSASEVDIKDVPEGLSFTAADESISVKVYAEDDVLAQLTKDDITLEASLSLATAETTSAAVTALCSKTTSEIVIKPQTITVKISEE